MRYDVAMDELQTVIRRIKATPRRELHDIAAATGVSFGALFKIKYGTTKTPEWATIQSLTRHFQSRSCAPSRRRAPKPAKRRARNGSKA